MSDSDKNLEFILFIIWIIITFTSVCIFSNEVAGVISTVLFVLFAYISFSSTSK